jgi:hypothetical protein
MRLLCFIFGKIRVTDGYLGNKVAVFYVYLHLTIVSPLVYMLMKKTVFSFVLVFIGICVALNGFAQNDKVSTFNLKLHDEPGYKVIMTVNPSQKEITQRVNDGEVRRINYYDYSIVQIGDINIGNFSFSLIPDIKAPKTGDECLTSEYYVFIGLNAVIVSLAKNRVLAFDYDMPKDKKVDQLAILTGNLLGIEPKGNTSSSSKSSSSTTSKPVTTNKATSSSQQSTNYRGNGDCVSLFNDKQLTPERMIDHPLGFLSSNSSSFTYEQALQEVKRCGVVADSIIEGNAIAFHPSSDDSNYDLKWKGLDLWNVSCIWVEGKMISYLYTFDLDLDGPQLINYAEGIVSSISVSKGIMFKDDPKNRYRSSNALFFRTGKYGTKDICINLSKGVSGSAWLDIRVNDF